MLIQEFCMTFITMTEKKKGKRKKSSGNPPTKILVILSQAEEAEIFYNK